jgi:hypothetical protein
MKDWSFRPAGDDRKAARSYVLTVCMSRGTRFRIEFRDTLASSYNALQNDPSFDLLAIGDTSSGLITQLMFQNDLLVRYLEDCLRCGPSIVG